MRLPRLRLKVSTLLAWTAVIALVLAVIAQQIAANRRERALISRFREIFHPDEALANLDRFVTHQGIDILKNGSSAELLRVQPTGVALDPEFALRAAVVLLDHRNYGYAGSFDDPISQIGLRIKSGASTLDILISLEGSSPGSPHQDVWIEIHDQTGKQVHYAGPRCMEDPTLQKLAEDLLKK